MKMPDRFGLTLVVNHACNLRCSYCYTGAKFSSPMSSEVATRAIQRAFRSVDAGGHLQLGFFGGEPLLEAECISEWMDFARKLAQGQAKRVRFNLTTNGTMEQPCAWSVMVAEDLELSVSFDGMPGLHDRHRRDVHGKGSAAAVERTVKGLMAIQKPFQVVTVVRPDTVAELPCALSYMYDLGVRHVHLSLDLWTRWAAADGLALQEAVKKAAELWRKWLPNFSCNWFDGKAADLAHLTGSEETTRCGFGHNEIAVASSGRLYPCERLVGEDRPDQPLRLPGHVLQGEDFLDSSPSPFARCQPCDGCALAFACDTICRCSNFIRTGDVNRPDGLLCLLNKTTARACANALRERFVPQADLFNHQQSEKCYV